MVPTYGDHSKILWWPRKNMKNNSDDCKSGPDGIPATAQEEKRLVELEHVFNAFRMSLQGKVKAPETIARQRIRTTLQDNCRRLISLHYLAEHGLEKTGKWIVVHT